MISAVPGFNDVRGQTQIPAPARAATTRRTSGGDSLPEMMDIGTSSPKLNLPSYLIQCNDGTQRYHQ